MFRLVGIESQSRRVKSCSGDFTPAHTPWKIKLKLKYLMYSIQYQGNENNLIERQSRTNMSRGICLPPSCQPSFLATSGQRPVLALTSLLHCFLTVSCNSGPHAFYSLTNFGNIKEKGWGKKLDRLRTCLVPGSALRASTYKEIRKEESKYKKVEQWLDVECKPTVEERGHWFSNCFMLAATELPRANDKCRCPGLYIYIYFCSHKC